MTARPPAPARRPTALDVARRAGVSRTTVSFVLNDHAEARGIPPATAERVYDAARALGYTPDRAARALRSGTSDLVVFASPRPTTLGPLALRLITELGDHLSAAGLHLITRRIPTGGTLHEAWRDLAPAAVLCRDLETADAAELEAAGIPCVTLESTTFNAALGFTQGSYLLDRGHRRLGYVRPHEPELQEDASFRLDGVRRACSDAGAPPPVVVSTRLDLESATAVVRELHADGGPTAVCAFDDDRAFAVLAGMAALGLRAPDDLAVIGVDNTPLAELAIPPLTTVDPLVAGGVGHLAQRIQDAIAGTTTPLPAWATTRLRVVQRRSA